MKVRRYGDELRRLVPDSGAYLNEDDWLEPGWRESFFGDGYARLLAVKQQVLPQQFGCLAKKKHVAFDGGMLPAAKTTCRVNQPCYGAQYLTNPI